MDVKKTSIHAYIGLIFMHAGIHYISNRFFKEKNSLPMPLKKFKNANLFLKNSSNDLIKNFLIGCAWGSKRMTPSACM